MQGIRPFFNKELTNSLGKNLFSVFIDETTDVSTNSQLAVIVTYFCLTDNETKGDVVDAVQLLDATSEGMVKQ